ncbi:hypothetical protein [Pseudochelatococcus sp. G4_1912]|uniref:hypothetical protein n=1 Tax=Pseudochelatococcus sp. G4_1912 TaxID=3114288 RepID=UPI0039C6A64A
MKNGITGAKSILVALAFAGGLGFHFANVKFGNSESGAVISSEVAIAEEAPTRVFPMGLGIGVVPPADMKVSTRFPGFEDDKHHSAIMMMEMPPELYAKLEKDLRDPEREPVGFTLVSREAWPVEGGKGFLVEGAQLVDGETVYKWVLARSTPASASVITFQVAEDAREIYTEDLVRRTLRSLATRDHTEMQVEVSKLPFTIDETLDDKVPGDRTGFRIARVIPGNSVMLTNGPKDLVQGAEQPVIVIGGGEAAVAGALEQDRFARQAFGGLAGVRSMQVRRGEGVERDGVSWHEIEADAEDAETGAKVQVIQAIRFDRTHFIRFVTVMREDAREETMRFLDMLRKTVNLRTEAVSKDDTEK